VNEVKDLPEGQQTLDVVLDQAVEPAPALSPGRCLREARESRGMSIADVTHAIKFSPRQIEALERDDFDSLPGYTFVRGIIRSYAKLLRIEEEPLLAMLVQQKLAADNEVHAPLDTGAELPLPGDFHSRLPLLALLVALAAVAVAAASYFGWPGSAEKQKAVAANVSPGQVPGQVPPTAVRTEQPAEKAAPLPSLSADIRELVFVFADKSWVEVKDATQKVIFAQNNAAGTRQVVSGKPPFALVIGNAAYVQLQYGDKPIDLVPYTKVEVARLNLE